MKSMMINIKKRTLLFLTVVLFCTSFVFAGVDVNSIDVITETPSSLNEKMQQIIPSIDVVDVPIEQVIRQLTEQADIAFITTPQVEGNVTVTLTNVTIEEALQVILDTHGCSYIKGENVVRIFTHAQMPQIPERSETKTFEIIYANVTQVVTALDNFKSVDGTVTDVGGTNFIIVTDTESKIREMDSLIQKIDRVIPQVLVEASIYDVTSRDNLDLGIEWGAGRRTNLDSLGNVLDDDITVSKSGSNTYLGSRTDPYVISGFQGATSKTADSTIGYLTTGLLNEHVNIAAQIRAEMEKIDAKLLANPRVMVIENTVAKNDIITEYPYVERTISGTAITETLNFKQVGVKLEVIPHITRDGMVKMKIVTEYGVVTSTVTVSSSTAPVVDTRRVETEALVRNGQTIVLGGLRKKDITKQVNKIPVLGDIPLIGNLFKFEGEATAVTEMIVFITPTIILEPAMSEYEQNAYEQMEFEGPTPVSTRAEDAIN